MALEGKYALITGSSRGIGRGIALKLAERGVNVGVHYYQNEAAANDTLHRFGKRALTVSWFRPMYHGPKTLAACSIGRRQSSPSWIYL